MVDPPKRRYKSPTKAELNHPAMQQRIHAVVNFDWSQHTVGDETPKAACERHFASLKAEHGSTWEKMEYSAIGTERPYPSIRQLTEDPMWLVPKNLASVPKTHRPAHFQPNDRKKQKRVSAKKIHAEQTAAGLVCSSCTLRHELPLCPKTNRCLCCVTRSLEYVLFTFHPESEHSGIHPNNAVHLIGMALTENWDVYDLCSRLQADHATDDWDEDVLYNRKTNSYSQIRYHTYRFQEILLGDLQFIEIGEHQAKTREEGDNKRSEPAFRALYESRHQRTVEYARKLDISALEEFTAPTRDPDYGGFNFDLHSFLITVLPYWEAKAKVIVYKNPNLASPFLKDLHQKVQQKIAADEA